MISPATGNILTTPPVSSSERSWNLFLSSSLRPERSPDITTLACAPVPGIANTNVSYFKKVIKPTKEELINHQKYIKSSLKKNFF